MSLLQAKDLFVSYGAIKAVQGVSFMVNEGETVALIGANGAGKSTILNTLAGIVKPAAGSITFRDADIYGAPSHVIVKMGMSLSPEGRRIFPRFTVRQNLEMGGYTASKERVKFGVEQAFELFPRLRERINQTGGTLSGGEQQMLAVARAMMNSPKLLMLDEPSLGLAPIVVQELFERLVRISKMGTTVLLVEQNARMALSISQRGYVVESGKIVLTDTGDALLANPKVQEAYFGGV